ncbi:hypothetical protein KFE98_11865 [bacterium SCSIO 12741]|nr:hypothetical protein KFE98_11865 [bacterium SCSIO 12741]
MKKLALAFSAFVLLSMTSCIKEHTCRCTDSNGDTEDITITSAKAAAKTSCEAYNTSSQSCALQ